MKKTTLLLLLAAALVFIALPASGTPIVLAQHRGGHGGFHGGHGGHGGHRTVIVTGGWGWGWGWGWGYPGYYNYDPGYAYGPPLWARIKTDVDPEEARLYLDGKLIGTADDFDGWPDYLYLERGHYRLEFRLTGYEPLMVDVDARPGTTVKIDDKMKKIPGAKRGSYDEPTVHPVLRFWGKKRDSVEAIDPRSRDRADIRERSHDRDDEDTYAPDPDRAPAPREPSRDSDWRGDGRRSDAPRATSVSTRSRLQLRIDPPDAAVYVDDRFVGTAEEVNSLDRGLSVSPGRHRVTVSRPGFKDRSLDVEVSSGGSEKVEISLSR